MPISTLEIPSSEYLKECIDYDPETGVAKWRHRPDSHFASSRASSVWKNKVAGTTIGSVTAGGYVSICLGRKRYLLSRVIWTMVNGPIPDGYLIDHINNTPLDNRLCNLRLATKWQNARNGVVRKRNKCGVKGIRMDRLGGWTAQIMVNKKYLHLGRFKTMDEAKAAYEKAAIGLHLDFARL